MGAGGIIHQQAKALLTTANEPCFFDNLPQQCKDQINAIDGKPELSRTREDVLTLLSILHVGVHC